MCDGNLVGVVSYGTRVCAVSMPDVFTRASEYVGRDFLIHAQRFFYNFPFYLQIGLKITRKLKFIVNLKLKIRFLYTNLNKSINFKTCPVPVKQMFLILRNDIGSTLEDFRIFNDSIISNCPAGDDFSLKSAYTLIHMSRAFMLSTSRLGPFGDDLCNLCPRPNSKVYHYPIKTIDTNFLTPNLVNIKHDVCLIDFHVHFVAVNNAVNCWGL